jgi:DNA adenine methylase
MGQSMFDFNRNKNNSLHWSPLRYPGGKTALHPVFDEMIVKKGMKNVTYIEPYAGGAGAALALLMLGKVDNIVINDLDKAIYSFWKSCVNHSERFIAKMYATPVSIAEREHQKAIYKNKRSKQFDLGFATFYLNRTNVSGIIEGGPIGGYNQKGKWGIDARFKKDSLAAKIRAIGQKKDNIKIRNKDGIELLEDFIGEENIFIYLDPPYFEKGEDLYLNYYEQKHHKALATRLNNNPDSMWVLSYDDQKEIRNLYKNRLIIPFGFNHHAHSARVGREIAILSDTVAVL